MSDNNESVVDVQETVAETSLDDNTTAVVPVKEEPKEDKAAAEAEKKRMEAKMKLESKAIVDTLLPTFEDFSVETLMVIIPKLIAHVQMYKKFTGSQKKQMIIAMVRHIIDITDGPGNDEILDPIFKRLVPSIIDTLVAVDQGKLKLKTGGKCRRKFLSCLMPCMG